MVAAFMSTWPWENLGNFKYLLYGPLIAKVLYSIIHDLNFTMNDWCLHILIICALRSFIYTVWCSYGNWHTLHRKRRIHQHYVDFKQIDSEWHWDNFIILQAFMAWMACYNLSFNLNRLPLWNSKGCLLALLFHVGVSEPLYYWVHRKTHGDHHLFSQYHSLHHASPVQQSLTAGHATPLEHLLLGVLMGIPMIGTCLIGFGSISMIYGYVIAFDCLRCLGLSYVEHVPHKIFEMLPFLRFLIYTPTYHSLHRKEMNTNFCLFMPLFDALGNTLNAKSWQLHKKIRSGENGREPDFVFLVHCVDVTSSTHTAYFLRSFAAMPCTFRLFLLPLLPSFFGIIFILWIFRNLPVLVTFDYTLRTRLHHLWCMPTYGFQYFLPFLRNGINSRIEEHILKADKCGVKVINLAALNKNESLNGGGILFVEKHPNLRVRVVHGNTLTAAVILNEIPKEVTEVFLTGATSKLGRAIALYLCRSKVRVMMLTLSKERFTSIQMEAPPEYQSYLHQVTKHQAGQNCKTWIVGKWLTPGQQRWAPPGTHFHQFVVPTILPFRRDCSYGKLAAMKLPEDVQGLGNCEYTMARGVVHACHAGGVVHLLEGYEHHEVGSIDVDMIDVVWKAALKHGLKPVSPY